MTKLYRVWKDGWPEKRLLYLTLVEVVSYRRSGYKVELAT